MPRLVSGVEAGFENLTFFSLVANVGVTQSFEFLPDDILTCSRVCEYRRRIVDANVKGVLPREVAQVAKVPMALFSRSLVRVCGQGAASVSCVSFRVDKPFSQLETFPACMFVPGIPQGQPSDQPFLVFVFSFFHPTMFPPFPSWRLQRLCGFLHFFASLSPSPIPPSFSSLFLYPCPRSFLRCLYSSHLVLAYRAPSIPSNILTRLPIRHVVCWTGKYQRDIYKAPTRAQNKTKQNRTKAKTTKTKEKSKKLLDGQ